MSNQVIQNQSDINKSNRFAKELKEFKEQLRDITSRSDNLLQNLKNIAESKKNK